MSVCARVREIDRKRERVSVSVHVRVRVLVHMCVCVCVFVCVFVSQSCQVSTTYNLSTLHDLLYKSKDKILKNKNMHLLVP